MYVHNVWFRQRLGCASMSRATLSRWVWYDDVIKRKHFPPYWPFVQGIHQQPVNSPHKGQWRGALMFSLICAWINSWINTREAGDLRRHRNHYDVIVKRNHGKYIFFHHSFPSFSALKRRRWCKPFTTKDKNAFMLHCQCHSCWWLGDARIQRISSHGINISFVEYSSRSTRNITF